MRYARNQLELRKLSKRFGNAPMLLNDQNAPCTSKRRIVNSILRSMGDGVVVTDGEGKLVVANPAIESILGFSPGGVPPRSGPCIISFSMPTRLPLSNGTNGRWSAH